METSTNPIFLLDGKYSFLATSREDSLELQIKNESTNSIYKKGYSLIRLKAMSPLLFFVESIEEAKNKLIRKLENKDQFKLEENDRSVSLLLNIRIDDQSYTNEIKLFKVKEAPLSIRNIEGFKIKPAVESDVPIILGFIKELALYEKAPEQVVLTVEQLKEDMFGERKFVKAVILLYNDVPIGFASYIYNYFTWTGRGLYLDDLYIKEEYRGMGIGKNIFAYLAKTAVDSGCVRIEWIVLEWNEPSIEFYNGIGGVPFEGWYMYRLLDDNLQKLASMHKD